MNHSPLQLSLASSIKFLSSQLSHGIFEEENIYPSGPQNFGDAPGQTPKLILTLCHMYNGAVAYNRPFHIVWTVLVVYFYKRPHYLYSYI